MSTLPKWSILQKAAQCVFPRLDTDLFLENKVYSEKIFKLIDMNIGGFCVFGGNPTQVEQMVSRLQSRAQTPLLMCADFENGLPMRLEEGTDFPHAAAMGKLGHEPVFKIAQAIAKEAVKIGIKWNLAPVADINTNIDNPVINIRAFGDDSDEVSQNVKSFIEGTQVEKVMACVKHFPGHGDTDTDSHLELPILNHNLERLFSTEFKPFIEAISNNAASIMIAHIAVPEIDNSGVPATLSPKVISILRDDLNFNGLIITDAMDMKAITGRFSTKDAAVLAILAGNNVVLMPDSVFDAIDAIADFAGRNLEFHEKLDESTRKIYLYKRKFGLIPQYQLLESSQNLFINHSKMALKYAYDAISKIGDTSFLPIDEKINFAGFAFTETDRSFRSATRFFTMLAQATENNCDFGYINTEINLEELNEMAKGVEDSELIIFAIFYRGIHKSEIIEKMNTTNAVMDKLSGSKKRIIILFGNPYIIDYLKADLFVLTYSDSFSSLAASIVLLTGREDSLEY